MATITKSTKEIEKTIKVKETVVNLQLSEPEAKTLSIILARVGGCTKTSLAKYSASMLQTLINGGYNWIDIQNERELNKKSEGIHFYDSTLCFVEQS